MLKNGLVTAISLLIISFLLYGCINFRVSSSYPPSILLDGSGPVSIENIVFSPEGYTFNPKENNFEKVTNMQDIGTYNSSDGQKSYSYLQVNEIELKNSSGSILLDKSVSEFITEAVKKEFKFMGYKLNNDAPKVISGKILELSVANNEDDGFVTRIQFKLLNKSTGKEYTKLVEGRFGKINIQRAEPTSGINASIAKAIEAFVRSAQGNGLL